MYGIESAEICRAAPETGRCGEANWGHVFYVPPRGPDQEWVGTENHRRRSHSDFRGPEARAAGALSISNEGRLESPGPRGEDPGQKELELARCPSNRCSTEGLSSSGGVLKVLVCPKPPTLPGSLFIVENVGLPVTPEGLHKFVRTLFPRSYGQVVEVPESGKQAWGCGRNKWNPLKRTVGGVAHGLRAICTRFSLLVPSVNSAPTQRCRAVLRGRKLLSRYHGQHFEGCPAREILH